MADLVGETVQGDGYAIGSLDAMGSGPGFRKIRRELGVEAMGINAIVLPEGYDPGNAHYHEEQEEVYFVHRGEVEIVLGKDDNEVFRLGPGGIARVAPQTVRRVRNVGQGEATFVIVGAKDGYVGRDGRAPEGREMTGPGRG